MASISLHHNVGGFGDAFPLPVIISDEILEVVARICSASAK
jgi:hypothetical protein